MQERWELVGSVKQSVTDHCDVKHKLLINGRFHFIAPTLPDFIGEGFVM